VTGFYGQNIPFPGYGQPTGFYTSAAVVVGLSAVLFTLFRRWDWL
jgi:magnesium transporter